jgi:TAP-like protein
VLGGSAARVLNSVASPSLLGNPTAQAVSFEQTFQFSVQTCVNLGNCPMGSSLRAVLARFGNLLEQLSSPPLPTGPDGQPLTAAAVLGFVQLALYNERSWRNMWRILGALFRGEPTALPSSQDSGLSEQAFVAISCLTVPQSLRTVSAAQQAGQAALAAAPIFGGNVETQWLTCAQWPVPSPPDAGQPIRAPGTPTILLVTNTVDPATPLSEAQQVHAALVNSVLVTNVAGGHGFYGMGDCTNSVVDNFLISATPTPGTVCHDRNIANVVGPAMAPPVPVTG